MILTTWLILPPASALLTAQAKSAFSNSVPPITTTSTQVGVAKRCSVGVRGSAASLSLSQVDGGLSVFPTNLLRKTSPVIPRLGVVHLARQPHSEERAILCQANPKPSSLSSSHCTPGHSLKYVIGSAVDVSWTTGKLAGSGMNCLPKQNSPLTLGQISRALPHGQLASMDPERMGKLIFNVCPSGEGGAKLSSKRSQTDLDGWDSD